MSVLTVHGHVREGASSRLRSLLARRRVAVRATILFLASLAAYVPAALHRRPEADVYMASLEGWRIASAHTPWLTTDIVARIPHTFLFELGTGPGDQLVAHRSPGVVLASIPAYLVAHTGSAASSFTVVPTSIFAALLTALSVVFLYVTVAKWASPVIAVVGSLTFAFATPIWVINGTSMWTHVLTVLGICGMAWAASRERWALIGLFGTIAIWGRVHTALIVAILGLGLAWSHRDKIIAVKVGLISGLGTAAASLWTHWLYGSWFPSGGYDASSYASNSVGGHGKGFVHYSVINQLGLWVSPGRGLLVWTPIILVLAMALAREWKNLPAWSRWLAVSGGAYLLVQGELNGFTGGAYFYGYRLALEFVACLAPALILTAHRVGPLARRLAVPVITIQFAAMMFGALSSTAALDPKDAWTDNSFWQAIRNAPGAVIPLTALVILIGLLTARIVGHERERNRIPSGQRALASTQAASLAAAAPESIASTARSAP